jgi:hypothetical protein
MELNKTVAYFEENRQRRAARIAENNISLNKAIDNSTSLTDQSITLLSVQLPLRKLCNSSCA